MSKYSDIIERLEKALKGSRSIDGDISEAIGEVPKIFIKRSLSQPELWSDGRPGLRADTWLAPRYTSSIDSAIALVERMLPGWEWAVGTDDGGYGAGVSENQNCNGCEAIAKTPAIAILIALFRALEAKENAA